MALTSIRHVLPLGGFESSDFRWGSSPLLIWAVFAARLKPCPFKTPSANRRANHSAPSILAAENFRHHLAVVYRQFIHWQTLFEGLPVMNFQVGPHAKNRYFTVELCRGTKNLGKKQPSLVIHFHLLTVIAGQVEVFADRIVHRACVGQSFLAFFPLRQGPDLGALAIRAGHVKLGHMGGIQQLLEGSRHFQPAFLIELRRVVAPEHVRYPCRRPARFGYRNGSKR